MKAVVWGSMGAGLLSVGIIAGALATVVRQPDTVSVGEADWADAFALDDLIDQSAVVVVGKVTSQREVAVEVPSPVDGKAYARRVDVFRTVQVQESIRGSIQAGQTITVVAVKSASRDLPYGGTLDQGPSEFLQLRDGRTYVFFLRSAPAAEYAQANVPAEVWGAPAEPAVAEVAGGGLKFLATKRYTDAARAAGLATGSAAVPASFHVDLAELKAAVATR